MCRHHLTKGLFLRTDEFQGSESQGQHIKSLLLSSRQQDEAEGAWAQAVVELFNPPVIAPGYYLWVVLLQSLGSKLVSTFSLLFTFREVKALPLVLKPQEALGKKSLSE